MQIRVQSSQTINGKQVTARQLEAHGRAGDVLLAISTSGNSANVLEAVRSAKKLGIASIALTGSGGGALAKEADIVYLPTDNLLASIADSVHNTNVNNKINVPIVCGEGGMNDKCGVATLSVDYSYLGRLAADIAFDILVNGKSPSEIPFKTQTEDLTYSINETVAAAIGFEIPQAVKDLVSAAE